MRTGRPVAKIEMSAEVAGILEGYTQRRMTAQALALRARIAPELLNESLTHYTSVVNAKFSRTKNIVIASGAKQSRACRARPIEIASSRRSSQ